MTAVDNTWPSGLCGCCSLPLDDHGYDGRTPMAIGNAPSQPPKPARDCPMKAGPKLKGSWALPE